jgi:ATP-dependent DNA helicase PIF1
MMIKNVDDQLVNGTVGKVIRFMTEREWTDSMFAGPSSADREETNKETSKEKSAGKRREEKKYPVVEWKIGNSRHSRVDLVRDESFKVEGPNGQVEVSRQQVIITL